MPLLVLLFIVAACGFSSDGSHRGSGPGVQSLYHYEAPFLNDVANITYSQYSGAKIIANVKVQSFPDHTLHIKIENPGFIDNYGMMSRINGQTNSSSGLKMGSDEVFSATFYQYLQQPFLIQTKGGWLKKFFVHRDEPFAVTMIKRSLLHALQQDPSGLQIFEVSKNLKGTFPIVGENSPDNTEASRNVRLDLIKQSAVSLPFDITSPVRQEYVFVRNGAQRDIQNNVCRRTMKGQLYPFAKDVLQKYKYAVNPKSLRIMDGLDIFRNFRIYRNLETGKEKPTSGMQQSQKKWGLRSPYWDWMVARMPESINILFSAPHSTRTQRIVASDKTEGVYKQEPHFSERLTYHLVLRLADFLGAGVVAWNDDAFNSATKENFQDPSYLNITEYKDKSPWWWIARSYKNNRMPKNNMKTMHVDIHQQTNSRKDGKPLNDLELGFSAMERTNNPLTKRFRNKMTEKITEVVCKYSYGGKKVKVINEQNSSARFGGNGTPVPRAWKRCRRSPKCWKETLKACYARQTQQLKYDLSVQFEMTNPLIQELIGNKPFFEEFARTIKSVYNSM